MAIVGCHTDNSLSNGKDENLLSNDLNCKDKVIIDTSTGSFCVASDSLEDVNIYKGIKYAKGGQTYRWQSAIASDDFTTPEEAGSFSDICAQPDISVVGSDTLDALVDTNNSIGIKGSEDCLSLNVYTPRETLDDKKSVLVWIHGGAFLLGSGSSVTFDPTHIVQLEDMVVVAILVAILMAMLRQFSLPQKPIAI